MRWDVILYLFFGTLAIGMAAVSVFLITAGVMKLAKWIGDKMDERREKNEQ